MNTSAIEKTIAELKGLLANPETYEEIREQAEVDMKKLSNWLEYYDWLNRLIDSFETKEIFNFIPIEQKKDPE
ncbi:DNA-binding transcriptional regulator GbsR (MarR family) [Salirhabdus euzebyi]|uniref:DNA-binding transcriptional regulator GbsR (MarR family) n=1 Tax=Salirhabdus euzebyi TaxID=394506 RepID=A0A841Q7C0_9BACI|nr:hypothetical protein [Salirhabdus euzebyi]MBB6454459.1 DNA-binding transcriptional regulator GbsR (MarR family) [Salirhabdus euzebyi]